jgi:hypothetical protein
MNIRLLTSRVTLLQRNRRGDVIDLPDAEAEVLIRTRQAEAVEPPPAVVEETGAARPVETAMVRPPESAMIDRNLRPRKPKNARPS